MINSPITIVGNMVNDPEMRFTVGGKGNVTFRTAVDRSYKDSSDNWVNESSFFNVIMWGQHAESVARIGSKGIQVIVVGKLTERQYEDKEGNKRSSVEIVADHVGVSARSIETFERRRLSEDSKGGSAPATNKTRETKQQPQFDEEPF
jgi:single-strand DNA-binding protein